jgi:putative tryptophan/tyrosine transport system ATP-binding protein
MIRLVDINLTFKYGDYTNKIFNNACLNLEEGSMVLLTGNNGCGKSTLLKIINGEINIDSGTILIYPNGIETDITKWPIYKRSEFVSYVTQDPEKSTVPFLTVEENMILGASRRGYSFKKPDMNLIYQSIESVDLNPKKYVSSLSGGQRQVLSLLMATYFRSEILLLDEHTAALDAEKEKIVMEITKRLIKNTTTIMISHKQEHQKEFESNVIKVSDLSS